jgi:hypothetical protein
MIKTLGIAAALVVGLASAQAFETPEFHIAKGTGKGAWNTEAEIVLVKVGDTLRIFNDDTVEHQLHTFGAPCDHGPNMEPGTSWDCVIGSAFEPKSSGALYDHHYGPEAAFWVRATAE